MNDAHRSADFDGLNPPLEAAVQVVLAGPIPEDAVERVKARAKQLGTTPVSPHCAPSFRTRRWRVSRSLIAGLTAAAALLAITTAGLLLLNHSSGRAFAQMIEKVKAANSVRFTTATRFGMGREDSGVMYLEGNRIRFEQSVGNMKLVGVGDLRQKQALLLDLDRKLAQQLKIDANLAEEFASPIDQLRHLKADDAEQIGEEILKGRRTRVYRLHNVDLQLVGKGPEMLLWVDVDRDLPAKIVIRDPDPKSPSEVRFEEFVWNEPLDARLFSLAIPDGFKTRAVADTPKPLRDPRASYADNPNYLADGGLSRDRVAAQIVWDPQGKIITALMRDPESVPLLEHRENELRQWDVATGKLRWSERVRGAGFLAATADGKTLAIVIGYEVQLRDAASGRITQKWATDEHLSPLTFSPDGKILAAGITEWGPHGGKGGKESGGVQFWDIERASLLRSISDDKPTTFVRYSVDGKYLATSSGESVRLWDVATGELTRIFPGIHRADFSPDGRAIACQSMPSSADKTVGRVDLYDLRDGSPVKSFVSEKGASASWLTCITFSPDGRLLAASDWNGTVTLWDVASGQHKLTIADHKAGVLSAAFAPDGTTLATGSEDKTLRLRRLPAELREGSR